MKELLIVGCIVMCALSCKEKQAVNNTPVTIHDTVYLRTDSQPYLDSILSAYSESRPHKPRCIIINGYGKDVRWDEVRRAFALQDTLYIQGSISTDFTKENEGFIMFSGFDVIDRRVPVDSLLKYKQIDSYTSDSTQISLEWGDDLSQQEQYNDSAAIAEAIRIAGKEQ